MRYCTGGGIVYSINGGGQWQVYLRGGAGGVVPEGGTICYACRSTIPEEKGRWSYTGWGGRDVSYSGGGGVNLNPKKAPPGENGHSKKKKGTRWG